MNTTSGAESAYRGFRWQFIYTIHKILSTDSSKQLSFQPEGNEDLAIFDKYGKLIEAIQVKTSERLSFSDLSKKEKTKESFFRRAVERVKDYPDACTRLVSLGSIGPEMQKAWNDDGKERQSIINKLIKHGISKIDAETLFHKVTLEQIDKNCLKPYITIILEKYPTGGDPKHALELLIYWIFRASENREKITNNSLITKINSVGRYLAERTSHHREWFTSIVPIGDTADNWSERKLKEEFYEGIAARYEHILAGVDVIRPNKLQEIDEHFHSANVVVIHGASGQGKSTLAYRYAHNFFPEKWQFAIRLVENRQHSLSIARALIEHVNVVNAPMLIYLDVLPRETHWLDLVREIAPHKNLHLLITVREEDWRRASLSGAEIQFKTIELALDESEARELYPHIPQSGSHFFLSFEDAWQCFVSEVPPLLEFVYFVTKNKLLRTRLTEQVKKLKNEVREKKLYKEEFQLLRLVSVASAYGARIDLIKLVEYLNLAMPEQTIELFEREFLLRYSQDERYVEGLHPVRSTILVELLTDSILSPWDRMASAALPLMPEEDLEIFLLHAFSRRIETTPQLLETLSKHQLVSWTGLGGVLRALLWLGVRNYLNENKPLIKEIYNRVGEGWWMLFGVDITNAVASSDNFLYQQENFKQYIDNIRERKTAKETVFLHATQWMIGLCKQPNSPNVLSDWSGIAETHFWAGYLHLDTPLLSWLSKTDLEKALPTLPLDYLAEVVFALSFAWKTSFNNWLNAHRSTLLTRFKQDTQTVFIEDDGETIRAHFILDIAQLAESDTDKDNNKLHEAGVHRVHLLRQLLPDRKKYGCQGYGHRVEILQLPHDDTEKTGIPAASLPPTKAVNLNATFRRLGGYDLRLDTWDKYVQTMLHLRTSIVDRLEELQKALSIYFQSKPFINSFDKHINTNEYEKCRELIKLHPSFPKCAVDEWGFIEENLKSDQKSEDNQPQSSEEKHYALALQQHKIYLSMTRTLTSSLSNFLTQALQIIILNARLGRAKTSDQKEQIKKVAEQGGININPRFRHLSTVNFAEALKALPDFQREFRQKFSHLLDIKELNQLEKRENDVFLTAWNIWFYFAHHPERVVKKLEQSAKKRLANTLEQIRKSIRKQFRKLSNEGIDAKIMSECVYWNGQPTLWISYNIQNPIELHIHRDSVIKALKTGMGTNENGTTKCYAYDFFWQNIAVVPLVKGRSLDNTVYTEEKDWWHYVPKTLSSQQLEELNLSIWETPLLDLAKQFRQAVGKLFGFVTHINDFNRLPEEQDMALLQHYVTEQSGYMSSAYQNVLDRLTDMLNYFSALTIEEQEQRLYLLQAKKVLVEIQESIIPANGDKEINMNMIELKDWMQQLVLVVEQSEFVYLYWVADVLSHENIGNTK
ncbi:hypothetical protein PN36_01115 [Candidatus Thiomargarita nelsonii]|uniref:Uncharacterized protein n=1 Tax=Candidatus Thiomargarita nelsonii TaxID=1003181 RepID=A0A0A6PD76_9GAMM|nr:hypothetical protein PN36_01115 [Candidatus Thiomargarita nelsonii]